MASSEYVKTKKLAASRRLKARRNQRRNLGFNILEKGSERAFASGSLHRMKQINTSARLAACLLMSGLENWWLTRIVVLNTELTAVSFRGPERRHSPEASAANWHPLRLRPNVHSGAEPDLHLSF